MKNVFYNLGCRDGNSKIFCGWLVSLSINIDVSYQNQIFMGNSGTIIFPCWTRPDSLLMICLFGYGFTSQSTAMVMLIQSVHLNHLFLGKLDS